MFTKPLTLDPAPLKPMPRPRAKLPSTSLRSSHGGMIHFNQPPNIRALSRSPSSESQTPPHPSFLPHFPQEAGSGIFYRKTATPRGRVQRGQKICSQRGPQALAAKDTEGGIWGPWNEQGLANQTKRHVLRPWTIFWISTEKLMSMVKPRQN